MESFHWIAALEGSPEDWRLRLVVADWLEENGSPGLAAEYRHIAAQIRSECRREALGACKGDVCRLYNRMVVGTPQTGWSVGVRRWWDRWDIDGTRKRQGIPDGRDPGVF